ncbi:MAG: hypothetical protein ACK6CU_11990 [Deltaproteobacteria bacterium]|jgi:hypothetical protein
MRTSIALALARTAALVWTAALAQPAVLAAQETPRVQVTDFTVDGNPPPAAYRDLLANAIRPTLSQVEQCYERRLSVSPQVRGDYRLRLWVSARQVIRATPESSVGDRELEECARAAIRQFTLPPQAPEGGATVRFVVRFTPPPPGAPAAPVAAPILAPIAPTPPPTITNPRVTVRIETVRGALEAPSLERTFPAVGFETCADGQTGEVRVSVAIDARGRVSARPGRGTLRDRAVLRCVERQLEALSAPSSGGRTRMRVVFTFLR